MQMLRSILDIKGYTIGARDGRIGRCSDFLFDDEDWTVRYIVADTHKWLPGRKVLISPIAIEDIDAMDRILKVHLTREQVQASPPLDADAPVSRQYEIAYNRYYQWDHYWGGASIWGVYPHPRLLYRPDGYTVDAETDDNDPNLRATREVAGYHVQAVDKDIGHVEDFIMDRESWTIRYLVIDTSNWLPASRKVLVSPDWTELVDWKRRKVLVNQTSEQIKQSPEYDPSFPVNRNLEVTLYDYYGRPYYWQ